MNAFGISDSTVASAPVDDSWWMLMDDSICMAFWNDGLLVR